MKQISNKTKITITLETDVYLKVKLSNINASALVNDFFKGYFNMKDEPLTDHEKVKAEAETKQAEAAMLMAKAEKMKKDSEEEKQETLEKGERMDKGIKAAQVLDFE